MPAKPCKKAARTYVKHGIYKRKRVILEQSGRVLDRRKVLDRAILEWEAAVIADLGGEQNLTTLQAGMLRALAWDRLFLDSAAAAMAEMGLVNKRNRRFHRVVLERAQLEDSFARRAAMLGLKRQAKPVLSLPEYIASKYGDHEPAKEEAR